MRDCINISTTLCNDPKFLGVARICKQPVPFVITVWLILLSHESSRDESDASQNESDANVMRDTLSDYAILYNLNEDIFYSIYDAFITKKMIANGRIVNFEKWQKPAAKSDAERARDYRERKKALKLNGNSHESPRDESDASQNVTPYSTVQTDIVCNKNKIQIESPTYPQKFSTELTGNVIFNASYSSAALLGHEAALVLLTGVKENNPTERDDAQVADEIAFSIIRGLSFNKDIENLLHAVKSAIKALKTNKKWNVPTGYYETTRDSPIKRGKV